MNIYQKKIVKEKEYIFYEDCAKTKSTYPNSKPDILLTSFFPMSKRFLWPKHLDI